MTFQTHLNEGLTLRPVGPLTKEQLLQADLAHEAQKKADPYGKREAWLGACRQNEQLQNHGYMYG